jgi:hypothetical protein
LDALFSEVKRFEKTKPGGQQGWAPPKTSEKRPRQPSQKFPKKTFEKQAIFTDALRLDKGIEKSNPSGIVQNSLNSSSHNAFNSNTSSSGTVSPDSLVPGNYGYNPVSRRARLERSLLSLLFTTCESMSFVLSILESNELQSEGIRRLVSDASALLRATDASMESVLTNSDENSLTVFTRRLQAVLSEAPSTEGLLAKQCLIDAVFEADTFLEQSKWQALPTDLLVANVRKQAQKLSTMLQQEIRRERLHSLNEQVRTLESAKVESAYTNTVTRTIESEDSASGHDSIDGDQQAMNNSLSLLELHYELREKVKKQVAIHDQGFISANDHATPLTLTYQSGNDTL